MRGVSLPELVIAMVVLGVLITSGLNAFVFAQTYMIEVEQTKQARDIALSEINLLTETDLASLPINKTIANYNGVTYVIEITGNQEGDSVDKMFWDLEISVTYPNGSYSIKTIKAVEDN